MLYNYFHNINRIVSETIPLLNEQRNNSILPPSYDSLLDVSPPPSYDFALRINIDFTKNVQKDFTIGIDTGNNTVGLLDVSATKNFEL